MKKNVMVVLMQPDDPEAEPVEEVVTVLLADQMRGELELKRRSNVTAQEAGVNFVAAMSWAALAREGRITCKFEQFGLRVYEIVRQDEAEAGDVDPTQLAASTGSASLSPSPTPAPAPNGGTSEQPPATTD